MKLLGLNDIASTTVYPQCNVSDFGTPSSSVLGCTGDSAVGATPRPLHNRQYHPIVVVMQNLVPFLVLLLLLRLLLSGET